MVPVNIVFSLLLISYLIAASNAPIQDCDETFNYWEPLHYLVHGYGLQTWEYSPEFSIRSWTYILLHALPVKLVSLFAKSKAIEFYTLRCLLAGICAAANTRLYSAICRSLHPQIGAFYVLIAAFTPGFFYASAAFLPSSFTMITGILGLSSFLEAHSRTSTEIAIMWFGIGVILGWPFAGALILPFVVGNWTAALFGSITTTARQYTKGILRCLAVLAVQVAIDSAFYRKLAVVPWRLVVYNVFSGKDRGPDIFGTEPWHFYVRNLLLNFNLWFLLAIAVGPLLIIQMILSATHTKQQNSSRSFVLVSVFYLWLAIFTLQPHKEERFMFPAYPFLALNAAMSLHIMLSWVGKSDQGTLMGRIPSQVKAAILLPIVLGSLNVGLLRILGTVTAYKAPIEIYEALPPSSQNIDANVCFGKDWYRFPTSFFLPHKFHAKFVKSEFDGLLPGDFLESNTSWAPGTWTLPTGMNDINQEDPSKHIDLKDCSFVVDSSFPSTTATKLEPDFNNHPDWRAIKCVTFLDNASTSLLARMLWIPDLSFIPVNYRRKWGKHCLFQRSS